MGGGERRRRGIGEKGQGKGYKAGEEGEGKGKEN